MESSTALYEILNKTGLPPGWLKRFREGYNESSEAYALELLKEWGFDDEGLSLTTRALGLDDRIDLVEIECGELHKGHNGKPEILTAPNTWIHLELKLKEDFKSEKDFLDYLRQHRIPTDDAYQLCAKSYDIEPAEGRPVDIHFWYSDK